MDEKKGKNVNDIKHSEENSELGVSLAIFPLGNDEKLNNINHSGKISEPTGGRGKSMYDSFGFRRNPFNITALRPIPADAALFVARKTEVNSFLVDIAADDRALVLVTGHRGVGKTSFASVLQFAVSPAANKFLDAKIPANDLIPCYHKVQIEPKESISNLLDLSP